MAPPERKLDLSKPLHAFCADLRALRKQAGDPPFLETQRKSGISRTALSEAVGGDHLPEWRTVEGFVLACGGNPERWVQRYERLQEQFRTAGVTNGTETIPDHETLTEPRNYRAPARRLWLLAAGAILLVVVTGVTVHMVDTLDAPAHQSGNTAPLPIGAVPIIVQNKMALGTDTLMEDTTPAYLSSQPIAFCSKNGCEGTEYDTI